MTNAVKALLGVFAALVAVIAIFVYVGVQAAHDRATEPAEQSYEDGQAADSEMEAQERVDIILWLGVLFLWLSGFAVYFIPAAIAIGRHHQNAAAIFLLNFLLGWTLLGWVASLVWSATAVRHA